MCLLVIKLPGRGTRKSTLKGLLPSVFRLPASGAARSKGAPWALPTPARPVRRCGEPLRGLRRATSRSSRARKPRSSSGSTCCSSNTARAAGGGSPRRERRARLGARLCSPCSMPTRTVLLVSLQSGDGAAGCCSSNGATCSSTARAASAGSWRRRRARRGGRAAESRGGRAAPALVGASRARRERRRVPPARGERPDAVLMDMTYRPLMTAFLAAGRARGLVVVDGLAMLIGQARPSFRAMFGIDPPEVDVRAVALRILEREP